MRLTFFAFLLKENILYLKLYPRFFKYIYRNLQYIHDFPNISIVTYNISTIRQGISIFRQTLTLKSTL
ncbi:hypothetical protein C6357_00145 [Bacillus wiedmannii]|uniref:Uncharacterized protein n=1 Tax=Bacillus wiedmannii TaxID=1890302 RepID=A0ABX5E0Z5_9BACI|nr:hypothetical protein C6357_00145 [Bacillus wiedmannii]